MIEITVSVPGGAYPVYIGQGALNDAGGFIAKRLPASSYVIISDKTVSRYYATAIRESFAPQACQVLSFPAGEGSKTRDTWTSLTDEMINAGVGRDAAVIALGGGVVGDLAGFVAATYHRGIPYVQIPTTLLAMVDSSVGGKTGVDTTGGKNLVGAFHQPALVLADTATLDTLPEQHFRAGLAEAVKHGAIADRDYFDQICDSKTEIVARDDAALEAVVKRSVEIKAGVVSEDEREAGKRAILNFGHTVGHGIESVSGFSLLHGEAISIGMVVESQIGEDLGITATGTTDRLREALAGFGLPVEVPAEYGYEDLVEAIRRDKKNRSGKVHFSPIDSIGNITRTKPDSWTVELPEPLLRTRLGSASIS